MSPSASVVAFCSLLTANLFAVLHERPWVGEWNWTFDTAVGAVILSAPVLAVVGGTVGLTLRRALPVLAPEPRRLPAAVRAIARVWLVGVAALAASTAVVVAMTAAGTHGGPATPWALLLGPGVLLVAGGLGIAVGYAAGRWAAVVLLGPGFFVCGGVLPGWAAAYFREGGTTGSLAGLAFDPLQVLAVVGGAVGLAGGAAALVALPSPIARVVGGVGAVVLVAALGQSLRVDGEVLGPGDETASSCETVSPVTVCVAPSNVVLLSELAASVATGAGALEQAGAEVPARFDALVPFSDPPPPDRGVLSDLGAGPEPVRLVLTPAPCAAWFDPSAPPAPGVFEAQRLIVDIVAVVAGAEPRGRPHEQWLRTAPADAQRAWLVEAYTALSDCRLDDITLPVR